MARAGPVTEKSRPDEGPKAPAPPPFGGSTTARLRRAVFGAPRNVQDPQTYHSISLVALLAWVGLGADGLSSSAYGPDEAFRALGDHHYLAVALALATALTVSRHRDRLHADHRALPLRRRRLRGGDEAPRARASAWSRDRRCSSTTSSPSRSPSRPAATPSSASSPPGSRRGSSPVEAVIIGLLVVLNLRGVKESVTVLAPIFVLFLVTHAIAHRRRHRLARSSRCPASRAEVKSGFSSGLATVGLVRHVRHLPARLLHGRRHLHRHRGGLQRPADHARAEGRDRPADHGSTWPSRWRSPPAASSLCYLLFHVAPEDGKTMNAVLLERFADVLEAGGLAGRATSSWSSRWSPRRRCSSSPPRPASSTGRGSWPTWPPTPGCRTASPSSPTGSPCRTASC